MLSAYAGNILVLTAPSGAGKTTLARMLIEHYPQCQLSISHTTRQPRPGEVHGKDYYFVELEEFLSMVQQGRFLEYATVHGNYYGTSYDYLYRAMDQGANVILDIDYQGAFQLKSKIPEAILVFILPPSIETLEERLGGRGKDNDDTIKLRMENACREILTYNRFDYVLVNHDLNKAYNELSAILTARELRKNSQRDLKELADINITPAKE
ncbi:guanylate kinase [Desulfurispira natronophila]|uniref:Guanylate kinase n=1 Tax=Desulfurispira natronophila TaxID=682562 RepID=A0A7W7Y2R4_9BACT|nr:guanylate kinase [Desulfurispira natronophila]MBB5021020.1 guanylate kinase [Desulfurispira natronophila]